MFSSRSPAIINNTNRVIRVYYIHRYFTRNARDVFFFPFYRHQKIWHFTKYMCMCVFVCINTVFLYPRNTKVRTHIYVLQTAPIYLILRTKSFRIAVSHIYTLLLAHTPHLRLTRYTVFISIVVRFHILTFWFTILYIL